jgi:sporulation protein YlmC with PRC-barrel domain
MRFLPDDLRHRTVLDASGLAIGEVEDLLFDPTSWHIEALRIRLKREVTVKAGVESSRLRRAHIDVSTGAVQSIGDAVLLSVPLEELAAIAHEGHVRPPAG